MKTTSHYTVSKAYFRTRWCWKLLPSDWKTECSSSTTINHDASRKRVPCWLESTPSWTTTSWVILKGVTLNVFLNRRFAPCNRSAFWFYFKKYLHWSHRWQHDFKAPSKKRSPLHNLQRSHRGKIYLPLPEMIYYFIWSTAQAAHPSWYFRYRAYGVWWALLPIRCLLSFRFASDKPVWIHPPPRKIWVSMAAKQLRHQSAMPVSAWKTTKDKMAHFP